MSLPTRQLSYWNWVKLVVLRSRHLSVHNRESDDNLAVLKMCNSHSSFQVDWFSLNIQKPMRLCDDDNDGGGGACRREPSMLFHTVNRICFFAIINKVINEV
jgi:hypothetical protein